MSLKLRKSVHPRWGFLRVTDIETLMCATDENVAVADAVEPEVATTTEATVPDFEPDRLQNEMLRAMEAYRHLE